jgi:hypothetical protein
VENRVELPPEVLRSPALEADDVGGVNIPATAEFVPGPVVPAIVEVPRDTKFCGHCRHLHAQLSPHQERAAVQMMHALDQQQARTSDGRRVTTVPTAIKWLLDQLGDGVLRMIPQG